jgi:hypothetical protein
MIKSVFNGFFTNGPSVKTAAITPSHRERMHFQCSRLVLTADSPINTTASALLITVMKAGFVCFAFSKIYSKVICLLMLSSNEINVSVR